MIPDRIESTAMGEDPVDAGGFPHGTGKGRNRRIHAGNGFECQCERQRGLPGQINPPG